MSNVLLKSQWFIHCSSFCCSEFTIKYNQFCPYFTFYKPLLLSPELPGWWQPALSPLCAGQVSHHCHNCCSSRFSRQLLCPSHCPGTMRCPPVSCHAVPCCAVLCRCRGTGDGLCGLGTSGRPRGGGLRWLRGMAVAGLSLDTPSQSHQSRSPNLSAAPCSPGPCAPTVLLSWPVGRFGW